MGESILEIRHLGKAFGSLRYDEALSRYPQPYQLVSFPESVFRSEI